MTIKNVFLRILLILALVTISHSASAGGGCCATTSIIEIESGATSGNVNGGSFDTGNANFLTNGAATSATGTAAVFTTASYNYAAGDVGAWIYVKTGTNWNPNCFYKITSVAANAATVNSAAGAGVCFANNVYTATTVNGVATVASPTSATFGIDYSQQAAAKFADTDLASTIGTTNPCTVTSAANPFGVWHVGNTLHITAGTNWTAGWYKIVSVSGSTATLDGSCGSVASLSSGTGKLGGALSLGSSDDAVLDGLSTSSATAATHYFIQGGSSITYTLGGTVSIGQTGNVSWPIVFEGYNTIRGDKPTGATRPTLDAGAAVFTAATSDYFQSLQFTGSSTSTLTIFGTSFVKDCKVANTGTGDALTVSSGNTTELNSEFIAPGGSGIKTGSNNTLTMNNYIHDSTTGITNTGDDGVITNNIIANNITSALSVTGKTEFIENNTLYGAENKLGTGIVWGATSNQNTVLNNILYGFATGVSATTVNSANLDDYNDYNNNTTDVADATKWQKGAHDITTAPSFTSNTQRTGTTATTTAGNHLVQSGATFQTWGVAVGDFVYISAGTGVTTGIYKILTVDSETQVTMTGTLTANATADKVWSITQGHNFGVGTNMKGLAFPGSFPAALSTGYPDIGAVQRQELSAGGSCASVN